MLKAQAARFESGLLALDVVLGAWVYLWVFRTIAPTAQASGELPSLLILGVVAALAFPVAMSQVGLYASQRREATARLLGRFAMAGAFATTLLVATTLLLQRPEWAWWGATCAFAQLCVFACMRLVTFFGLRLLRVLGRNFREVVVVGTGPRARAFVDEVDAHPEWGIRIAAYLDESESATDPMFEEDTVHKLSDFPRLIRSRVVDEVVVAIPRSLLHIVAPVVGECSQLGVPVTLLSDLFGDYLPTPRLSRYGRLPVLQYSQVPHSRLDLALKRLIDIVGASLMLTVSLPFLCIAALAVRLTSPGPVLFRQTRCGLNGRRFEMLKLRSMVVDAEERKLELVGLNEMDGPVFKIHDDPRVTPVGRFLRRWSLDECPQFWNVLKGDMSVVGPRPAIPSEVASYHGGTGRRLSMRPGITCLWQISGRNEISFDEWVKLDLLYIDSWSLGLDLSILARTPAAVFHRRGAS